MNPSHARTLLHVLRAHPGALFLAIALAVLLMVFLMQCAWTIRNGGSLTIGSILRLDVASGTGSAAETPRNTPEEGVEEGGPR